MPSLHPDQIRARLRQVNCFLENERKKRSQHLRKADGAAKRIVELIERRFKLEQMLGTETINLNQNRHGPKCNSPNQE